MNGVAILGACAKESPLIPVTCGHALSANALSDRGPVWNVAWRAVGAVPHARSRGQRPFIPTSIDARSRHSVLFAGIHALNGSEVRISTGNAQLGHSEAMIGRPWVY